MSCHPLIKSVNYPNSTKNVQSKVAMHVQYVKENNVSLSFCKRTADWEDTDVCFVRAAIIHFPARHYSMKREFNHFQQLFIGASYYLILSYMPWVRLQSLRLLLHLWLEECIISSCLDVLKGASCRAGNAAWRAPRIAFPRYAGECPWFSPELPAKAATLLISEFKLFLKEK